MSHILINAKTGAPVPLPHYTITALGESVTVHDFNERCVFTTYACEKLRMLPEICGLAIITEEEFMARQEPFE